MSDSPPSKSSLLLWLVWISVGLFVSYFFFLPTLFSLYTSWPPDWVDRRRERQKVLERVQSVGGWAALQKDCDALVDKYRDRAFLWDRDNTNALPPTLAGLKPSSVQFYSPTLRSIIEEEPRVAVVRIKIFGMPRTGEHSTPYFGLEVVSGAGSGDYRPRPSGGGVSGNRYSSFRPVTDRIYEVY